MQLKFKVVGPHIFMFFSKPIHKITAGVESQEQGM